MKKDSERKNEVSIDIHGRIEALDQSLRSVDYRLRAVEKRLSVKTPKPESDRIVIDEINIPQEIEGKFDDTKSELTVLQKEIREIQKKMVHIEKITNDAHVSEIQSMETQLADAEHRITKLENVNKITIGKIKVPIEISGLAAMIVLLVTGYLISMDQWSIIRSPFYPIIIGILFGIVVIIKFLMTNRK